MNPQCTYYIFTLWGRPSVPDTIKTDTGLEIPETTELMNDTWKEFTHLYVDSTTDDEDDGVK